MSISNRHTVNKFVAGKSEPLSGQRLAKIGYKKSKDNPNPLPSVCVSVPQIDPQWILNPDNVKRIASAVATMLEDTQDKIIRVLNDNSGGTLSAVSDSDISFDAIVNYLMAESSGDRLSSDSIGQWFDSGVKDALFVVFAEKLGFNDLTPDNEAVINKHVASYRDICTKFASKGLVKESFSPQERKAFENCCKLNTGADTIPDKMKEKLAALDKKIDIAEMLELDL